MAEYLGKLVRYAGVDVLFVDSVMPAVGLGEDRLKSDPQVPYLWVAALDALGIPSLSFGHPPKGQPEGEPFGSFAWVAAVRLTLLGTKAEGDAHRIRWRARKRNERGHIPGVLLTVDYGDDGRPCHVDRADDEESTRDWISRRWSAARARSPTWRRTCWARSTRRRLARWTESRNAWAERSGAWPGMDGSSDTDRPADAASAGR